MSEERRSTDAQVAVLQNDMGWVKSTITEMKTLAEQHRKESSAALARIEKKLEEGAKSRDNLARLGAIGSGIGTALVAWFSQFGGQK